MRQIFRSATSMAIAGALILAVASCGKDSSGAETGNADNPPIGTDLPRADTDFWTSYAKYVPTVATELGVNLMTPTNSQNDVSKLVANAQALVSQGAKAIVMAPQDTGAIASTLTTLQSKKVSASWRRRRQSCF